MKWTIAALAICLSIMGCGKVIKDMSSADEGPRDMDWFYKHNGYAIMNIVNTENQLVMEIVAIPLNSEAILPLVHEDISDILYYFKERIEQQRPVIHLTVYAHRDCCFSWPNLMLQQGQGRVYPASVISLDVPGGSSEVGSARMLVAAASELFAKYGERKVRGADHVVGLFTNPYTGRNMLELDAEIEMMPGETLSAIAIFGGGLKLNQPFRLVSKSRRFVLLTQTYIQHMRAAGSSSYISRRDRGCLERTFTSMILNMSLEGREDVSGKEICRTSNSYR